MIPSSGLAERHGATLCALPLDLVPDQNSTLTDRYFADLMNPLVPSKEENEPIPVAMRSAAACLLELRVRIPPETLISVSRECCVLSGRCLCVGPISRPEAFFRLWSLHVL